ncbi:MAG TPA: 6-carboxytetrahydropterin synthase [Bacteroidales bacterium]|nr:6-carboxytetrahydropterin synthase [Bacteroidales bacterium]
MSSVIRVTKEFGFEMAHALFNHDGPCRNVHGHSYRLFVTVSGVPENNPASPKNGMVIDFSDLKRIVRDEVIDRFDHAFVISGCYNCEKPGRLREMSENTLVVNYQPTCENLVADFAGRIIKRLPGRVKLCSLKLYETASSYAEWVASDNE